MPADRDSETGRFTTGSPRRKTPRFKRGDQLRVRVGGNYFPAVVYEADRNWVRVHIWAEGVEEPLSASYRPEELAEPA